MENSKVREQYVKSNYIYNELLSKETGKILGEFKEETLNAFIDSTKAFNNLMTINLPNFEENIQLSTLDLIETNNKSIQKVRAILSNRIKP